MSGPIEISGLKFYPVGTASASNGTFKRRRYNKYPIEDFTPYLRVLAIVLLSPPLIHWYSTSWFQRATDLTAFVICLALHHFGLPIFSACFAASYSVWYHLPGSFVSLDAPSYSEFMRALQTIPSQGENKECMVCWDDKQELGILPCKHQMCRECLKLMHESYQTACPLCHKALFSYNDWLVLALSKGWVSICAAHLVIVCVAGAQWLRKSEYLMASLWILPAFSMLGWVWSNVEAIRTWGKEWWRLTPDKRKAGMKQKYAAFLMQFLSFAGALINMYFAFK